MCIVQDVYFCCAWTLLKQKKVYAYYSWRMWCLFQRHRMVNHLLDDEVKGGVHALSIQVKYVLPPTPNKEKKNKLLWFIQSVLWGNNPA